MSEARELRPDYYTVEVRVTNLQPRTGSSGTTQKATLECFDLIDALALPYYAGNALKYLFRWGRKADSPAKDMRKALTFCQESAKRECK